MRLTMATFSMRRTWDRGGRSCMKKKSAGEELIGEEEDPRRRWQPS
jgi:hypothetical protein